MDMLPCLQCLQPTVPRTTLRQCHRIALAMLAMTGRVTMLGLSRWAGPGGSYRTVQRFFATVIPWATLFWVFFRRHVYRPEVRDHRVATRGRRRAWRSMSLSSSIFLWTQSHISARKRPSV